jgi:hypothetical protein
MGNSSDRLSHSGIKSQYPFSSSEFLASPIFVYCCFAILLLLLECLFAMSGKAFTPPSFAPIFLKSYLIEILTTLQAAAILSHITPPATNAPTGRRLPATSLPEDRSLWPTYLATFDPIPDEDDINTKKGASVAGARAKAAKGVIDLDDDASDGEVSDEGVEEEEGGDIDLEDDLDETQTQRRGRDEERDLEMDFDDEPVDIDEEDTLPVGPLSSSVPTGVLLASFKFGGRASSNGHANGNGNGHAAEANGNANGHKAAHHRTRSRSRSVSKTSVGIHRNTLLSARGMSRDDDRGRERESFQSHGRAVSTSSIPTAGSGLARSLAKTPPLAALMDAALVVGAMDSTSNAQAHSFTRSHSHSHSHSFSNTAHSPLPQLPSSPPPPGAVTLRPGLIAVPVPGSGATPPSHAHSFSHAHSVHSVHSPPSSYKPYGQSSYSSFAHSHTSPAPTSTSFTRLSSLSSLPRSSMRSSSRPTSFVEAKPESEDLAANGNGNGFGKNLNGYGYARGGSAGSSGSSASDGLGKTGVVKEKKEDDWDGMDMDMDMNY